MSELMRVCQLVKVKGASDMHLFPDQPVFYRLNGQLEKLDSVQLSEDQIKKIILETSTPKAREILGKQRQVTYAEEVPTVGRLRFSVFLDKGKFALAIRFINEKFFELDELGFTEGVRKVISQPSGLILVGSPSCEGKTSTIAAMLNFINRHFEKSIFTIENPVEYVFKDDKAAFIQRSIPVDISNFYNGLCEAYRVDPDVVVSDSINYPDAMDQALTLCESGCMVIGSTEGGDCQQILERLINCREPADREALRARIAAQLKMIVSQRLVPREDKTGRVAIFDIMINTPQMKALVRNNNMSMFRALQGQGEIAGMKTFDSQLAHLVRKRIVSQKVGSDFAIDKSRINS
ncbi:MAG TPA: ATPase, T2SS/T4P/T4SS family [Candidatus Rifleibacterium sp.]|nr:ATPase, T2SS/T4P/T4SS family [Candidatus Rifleibacterium sp.]HPW59607.1 ATPase, T2SS/T4P/T4SS family [Candidatus Rifleibacterium sp.]